MGSETTVTLDYLRCLFELTLNCFSDEIEKRLGEARIRWQGVWGLNKICHFGSMLMQCYVLITDRDHLRKVRAYVELGADDFTEWGERCEDMYGLVALTFNDFYVGKTVNKQRRCGEHLMGGLYGTSRDGKREYSRLYRRMKRHGPHFFFMVRIRRAKTDLAREEISLIRAMDPGLNQSHVRKRRRKGRKRPVASIRENCDQYSRKRQCVRAPPEIVLYSSNEKTSYFLEELLDEVQEGDTATVSWGVTHYSRRIEFTNWNVVSLVYGTSKIVSPVWAKGMQLKSLCEHIKTIESGVLAVSVERKSVQFERSQMLREVVSDPGKWARILPTLRLRDLLGLLLACEKLGTSRIREKCEERIQSSMKSRYFISKIPKVVISVPYRETTETVSIRKAFLTILRTVELPEDVEKVVMAELRVVFTRRKKISDVLHNFKRHALAFDASNPPMCTCDDSTDGHELKLPTDFNGLVGQILQQNSQNIPYMAKISARNELYDSLIEPLQKLERLVDQYQENKRRYDENGWYLPDSCQIVARFKEKNVVFQTAYEFLDSAGKDTETHSRTENCDNLSLDNVMQVKKELDGKVVVSCDKNSGVSAVMCPQDYWERMHRTFITDKEHYSVAASYVDEEFLINLYEKTFWKMRWDRIAPLRCKKALPSAYTVPKWKAPITRDRPIVSYYGHPLKNVFRVAQKAIMFALKKWPERHFSLYKTGDYVKRLKTMEKNLGSVYGDSTGFLPVLGDVKEMFTNLRHDEILEAVQVIVDSAKKMTRSKFVRVPKSAELKPSFGKSANKFTTSEISFEQIMGVVRFDLDYAFFSVGTHVVQQKKGAPIGGVISSAYAIVTCAVSEHKWLTSLGADSRLIDMTRYVDDTAGMIAYDTRRIETAGKAIEIRKSLYNDCYPDSLVLEEEPFENGEFRFLETTTKVEGTRLTAVHFLKNKESISSTGQQKFYNLKDFASFEPRTTKKGVIIARLMAIKQNCSREEDIATVVLDFFTELKTLGYSNRFLKTVCRVMSTKDNLECWEELSYNIPR